mgnify:CR=1 FL=1
MNKIYILLVGLLITTQAYALNKTQRNVLFGVGAGAILVYALESQDKHKYERQPIRTISRNSHFKEKKHHRRMHKKMHHKKPNYYSRHHHKHARKHYRKQHRNNYYAANNSKRYCAR